MPIERGAMQDALVLCIDRATYLPYVHPYRVTAARLEDSPPTGPVTRGGVRLTTNPGVVG